MCSTLNTTLDVSTVLSTLNTGATLSVYTAGRAALNVRTALNAATALDVSAALNLTLLVGLALLILALMLMIASTRSVHDRSVRRRGAFDVDRAAIQRIAAVGATCAGRCAAVAGATATCTVARATVS